MDKRWRPKTAVLIHTYNFRHEPNWLHVMWGRLDEPGRIPTAVAAALEFQAELLFTFNGDVMTEDGRTEGQLMRRCLFDRIEELSAFGQSLPVFQSFSPGEIRDSLEKIFQVYGTGPVNTEREINEALPVCREHQIEMLISVSSWDHISRIGQLFGALWRDTGERIPAITIRPARSLYSNAAMKNVVVFEPRVVQALGTVDPRRLLGLPAKGSDAIARIDVALKEAGV